MATRSHHAILHRSPLPGTAAMTLVSDHRFPRHSHDQFGIGVMASGAQRSWSGIGWVDAGPGDVIMVNPGEMHDGVPVDGAARVWSMIYLDPVLVAAEADGAFAGPLDILPPVARDPLLRRHFAALFGCLTRAPLDRLARDECLLRLLVCALRHGRVRARPIGPAPAVATARRHLDALPHRSASLADLAGLSGVTRFQLLRGFARDLGTTPHAYLVQRRVRRVRQLLADGHGPAEAALEAGFADQSHMTRAFVRQFGVTPARYRAAIA